MRDIRASFSVENLEIDPFTDHSRQISQHDVTRGVAVIEPPVCVLLDYKWLFVRHWTAPKLTWDIPPGS